jgi:hypothetical protein
MSSVPAGQSLWHVLRSSRFTRRQAVACTLATACLAVLLLLRPNLSASNGAASRELGSLAQRSATIESPATGDVTLDACSSEAASSDERAHAKDRETNSLCIAMLRKAEQILATVETIQAVFHKQEYLRGQLQELNIFDLKQRRSPLSVYMRWQQPTEGQEALWQDQARQGNIMVHLGGWRGKVVPTLQISPQSPRALENSRRPIQSIGLWNFNQTLLEFVTGDATASDVQADMADDAEMAGRRCYCFRFVHPQRREPGVFQKVLVYIDKQLALPIGMEHYVWPEEATAEPRLDERYAYYDLRIDPPLTDLDFDPANPSYRFGLK